MITSHPPTDEGSSGNLDVRWCVFFPVGKQPQDTLPLNLVGICRNITINLHGFFFLDSERLRIDGLEETFNPNGPTVGKTCLKWNEVIATDGTLARLHWQLLAKMSRSPTRNLLNSWVQSAIQSFGLTSKNQSASSKDGYHVGAPEKRRGYASLTARTKPAKYRRKPAAAT